MNLISSACPMAVEVSVWWSCGVVNGPIIWPGTTTWIVGMADATKSMVYCSGITCDASSAMPSAASLYALCASANLKKTLETFLANICIRNVLAGAPFLKHRRHNF